MSRKHNTKHHRGQSNYKSRLEARGLTRTPMMTWTGRTTTQLQEIFSRLPRYRWIIVDDLDHEGRKIGTRQVRQEIRG